MSRNLMDIGFIMTSRGNIGLLILCGECAMNVN
jgi:hypothetical protein